MPLFDCYMAVDWSASNSPKTGKDSIWVTGCSQNYNIPPRNISTRHEVVSFIKDHVKASRAVGERLIIGFDFAFGYPSGFAKILGGEDWQFVWRKIYDLIEDSPKNKSNRFDVATKLNRLVGQADGPFWGHPHQHSYSSLGPKKPITPFQNFSEFRIVESRARGSKSVWQLAYNGAVGSQTLLGIAALESLRRDPEIGSQIAIWPFETDFASNMSKPIIFAEIYPSSHEDIETMPQKVLDAQQVAKIVQDFKNWDATDELGEKLSVKNLSRDNREAVLREEGWIVGQ